MGRHVLEVAGSLVVVEDGRIVSLSKPRTARCPLRSSLYGIEKETVGSVRRTVEFYIKCWGMFTGRRVIRTKSYPVSFGISEIFASGLRQGVLDAVVSVCEGAGTVISSEPDVVQGIGAHMTGLIRTSPEPSIIRKLVDAGVTILSPGDAKIDQIAGVAKGVEMGHKSIAVTVTGRKPSDGPRMRTAFGKLECAIASVHNTGMSQSAARKVAASCDLVTSCASKWAREIVARRAVMQLGLRIPVFVLTPLGKELALAGLRDFPKPIIVGAGSIPILAETQPHPLR
mgnify:CR=1 FL=1